MHTFEYTVGMWNVQTSLEDAGDSKRLAIISARTGKAPDAMTSRHIVVFEHDPECDDIEEAKTHTERALNGWH